MRVPSGENAQHSTQLVCPLRIAVPFKIRPFHRSSKMSLRTAGATARAARATCFVTRSAFVDAASRRMGARRSLSSKTSRTGAAPPSTVGRTSTAREAAGAAAGTDIAAGTTAARCDSSFLIDSPSPSAASPRLRSCADSSARSLAASPERAVRDASSCDGEVMTHGVWHLFRKRHKHRDELGPSGSDSTSEASWPGVGLLLQHAGVGVVRVSGPT
mmetsp:Transcript_1710/g.5152  ORF Transcript_1710/g.5152 Transcript_1710/m.5152 type:complete len:216 (+) Transcript_1710:46-693(+)